LDRRSEAIAQLLETALSERFLTPVTEVIQAVPIAVGIVHAEDLRILTLNDQMAGALGRPATEAVGRSIVDLVPSSHPLADRRSYHGVASSGQAFEATPLIDNRFWQWFIRPLKGADRSIEHLLIGLVPGAEPLSGGDLSRLLEMNATKTEFLNLAAHELRTPLGVIHGYASLLAQGGLSAEHQRLAGIRIYEKAKHLSRLINDLSLVARLDELGPSLAREDVDLVGLLEPVVDELQRRFPDLAIDFQFGEARAEVTGDPYWLRLAVRELLDNAIRFRPSPGGRIDLSISSNANSWVISVLDDGFGIRHADQDQLFERFGRIETDENQQQVGIGIGLYMVREVARAHGGRVSVSSRAGAGSEFVVELPRASGLSRDR
jgi:signal transduction histidine kinase